MSIELPMTDDTRELLNAHHAAVLRELDEIKGGVRDIGTRTNHLEHRVGVLSWAYGIAAALLAGIAAKFGFGGGGQ